MSIGFVYMLKNDSMPGLFKVGYTDKSPSERARQLSAATGVPEPFDVMCYIEIDDAKKVEAAIHARANNCRVGSNKEFFSDPMQVASLVLFFPDRVTQYYSSEIDELFMDAGYECWWNAPDPWEQANVI